MKNIVAITHPRHEADVLESFCRHTLTFCDSILVFAGVRHADNTMEILEGLISEGMNIRLYHMNAPLAEVFSLARTNVMVKYAFEQLGADLVLPLDPDEFLFHVDGINPRIALERLPAEAEVFYEWRSFIYDRDPDCDSTFLPDFFTEYRTNHDWKYFKKTAISKLLFEKYSINTTPGSHFLDYPSGEAAPAYQAKELMLAHYPLRGTVQVMIKILTGELYNRARQNAGGFQWSKPYKDIVEAGGITPEEVREMSIYYAIQPEYREEVSIKNGAAPFGYYEHPALKYTRYNVENMEKFLIQNLCMRFEESIELMHALHAGEMSALSAEVGLLLDSLKKFGRS